MLEFSTYIQNNAPRDSSAHLELRIHMFGGWGIGPKGEKLITPGMISAEEVDHHINNIIQALECIRLEAKAKLEENHGAC